MRLFWRRPLCFSCFLFLLVSFFAAYMPTDVKPWLILFAVAMLLLSISVFAVSKIEKIRSAFFMIFMSVLFITLAFLNSYLRMDIPQRDAESFVGKQAVELLVVSEDYSSEYSSEYTVKIKQIGDRKVDIKAVLICGFDASARPFDKIYAVVDLSSEGLHGENSYYDDDVLLGAYLDEPQGVLREKSDDEGLFVKMLNCGADGIAIGARIIKENISEYVVDLFGEEAGGLATGLLMNDKSEISPELVRDFRRSGVSHLLTVSGLHISLLVGAIELLLRKLRISKNIRCVALAVSAVLLLALAGFSMSSCRSVFMLLILYINYMLLEGNDSPTSLFFSVFLIVLFSPYSIYDLGLFMSFTATLGLVTVYPVFESFSRERFLKKLPNNILSRIILGVINSLAITIIANIFLLPVMWFFFGEISIASIPVNILISPIVSVLLPLIALGSCLGKVFFIGDVLVAAVKFLCGILTGIISAFSRMSLATVSLRYDFANVIILAFIAVMVIFMVIELKRKWFFAIPPAAAVIAFCISISVFNITAPLSLNYYTSYHNDLFFSVDKGKAIIIDCSSGNIKAYEEMLELTNENAAVSIESIFITRLSSYHVSSMDHVIKRNIVNRLYIPEPQNEEETRLSAEIYNLAKEQGVSVELYERYDVVGLSDDVSVAVLQNSDTVISCKDNIVLYTNESVIKNTEISKASDMIVIGSKGDTSRRGELTLSEDTYVIFSSKKAMEDSEITFSGGKVYALGYQYFIELGRLFD